MNEYDLSILPIILKLKTATSLDLLYFANIGTPSILRNKRMN